MSWPQPDPLFERRDPGSSAFASVNVSSPAIAVSVGSQYTMQQRRARPVPRVLRRWVVRR